MISYWRYVFNLAGIDTYFLLVKGDDVLLGVNPEDIERFTIAFHKVFTTTKCKQNHGLGQIAAEPKFGSIIDAEFISCQFFETDQGKIRLVRPPARIIQLNSFSTKMANRIQQMYNPSKLENSRKELCYSKGSCLLSWAVGLPIWEKLARTMMRIGRPGSETEFSYYADYPRWWSSNRDDYSAYLNFLGLKYNITKEDVRAIEARLDSIQTTHGLLEVPEFAKFVKVI
jgi:hypothetical protein